MPPHGELIELVEYTWEIGPVEYGGAGLVPLTWQEIQAWQQAYGIELDALELEAVKTLSNAYAGQFERSRKKDCPPPWVDPEQINRDAVHEKILQQFRAFNQRRKKGKT